MSEQEEERVEEEVKVEGRESRNEMKKGVKERGSCWPN